jgi:hypothetical protein
MHPLDIELERATLRALRRTYDDLNGTFFRWQLRRPVLELSDSDGRLGRWHREHRTIEISKILMLDRGWGATVEVLKHEMAHQFVDEVLAIQDQTAHGPAFRRTCEERGIDARAAGMPSASPHTDEQMRVLERVAKLLALAESSNEHEAQSAMSAAQRLMLKYNLDSVRHGDVRAYAFRHLGKPSGRVDESQRVLAVILGEHFFVEAIWVPVWRPLEAKRGSVLEVCGSPENLELAEYVHVFVNHTADRLWKQYKREHRIRKNANRRTFIAGVMAGFREKLDREKQKSDEEGLVWVGDAELAEFFRARHPHVRTKRYGGRLRNEAYVHGRQAGERIVLHRGVSEGASGSVRLLPGRG